MRAGTEIRIAAIGAPAGLADLLYEQRRWPLDASINVSCLIPDGSGGAVSAKASKLDPRSRSVAVRRTFEARPARLLNPA